MTSTLDNVFGVQAAALKLRAQRTQLIAENLANADTPDYKARDIDFKAALQQATAGMAPLAKTHPDDMEPAGYAGGQAKVLYRVPYSPSLDGNTVETQVEQAQFAQNSVQYRASLTFLGNRINDLIEAIKGT